jgi:hypothetical protein
MNAVDIQRLLRGVNSYRGTLSCDTLPNKTGLVISNTDPHNLPGEHWIAIYISPDRRYGEYFDSFGRVPNGLFTNYETTLCMLDLQQEAASKHRQQLLRILLRLLLFT